MIIASFNLVETFENAWGKNKEYGLQTPEFQLFNSKTGLPDSSFEFEQGTYELIVSTSAIVKLEDNATYKFQGVPRLCGSEEDNLDMEEFEEDFKRDYALYTPKLSFVSNILNDTDDVYIYVSKIS